MTKKSLTMTKSDNSPFGDALGRNSTPSMPSAPQNCAAFRYACMLACALNRPILRIDLTKTALNAQASS